MANLVSVLASQPNANNGAATSLHTSASGQHIDVNSSPLLGTGHTNADLCGFHPSPEHMLLMWEYYTRNVDMMLKVIYKPTVQALIETASNGLAGLAAGPQALLFAVWFAVVSTLNENECLTILQVTRRVAIHRYRFALEQSLVQAGWMMTQDIAVLQALTIHIVSNQPNSISMYCNPY